MTDMFITKKERLVIILEAIVYILLIILASYFTICGNLFIRMVPMIYFVGIFGTIMFKKPIVTVILGTVSILTFGCLAESTIDLKVVLLAIYSAFMITFGECTGHILNVLYENFKLRKFIKYYHKIAYVIGLVLTILIPVFLNNLVNSNMISYAVAKKNIDEYINKNYAYSEYWYKDIKYIPNIKGAHYEFVSMIDNKEVVFRYMNNNQIADVNMEKRKENLNKIANAEINIMLKENNLTYLDITCVYDYSNIETNPDIITLNIDNVNNDKLSDITHFISVLKNWSKFAKIEKINILIDDKNVSISKGDLNSKNIDEEYLLNGTKQEILDSKEGI